MSLIFSKLLLFLVFPFSLYLLGPAKKHPFHVSTTEIAYNTKSKSLEITCRVFTDDFEDILTKKFKSKIDLSSKNDKKMQVLVKSYIEANLKFSVDGKLAKYNFLGFENDHEATNIYLEISNMSVFKAITCDNGILYDLFDDQLNILHVEKNGVRKSTKASYPDKKMSLLF